jgi:hypothetical protein
MSGGNTKPVGMLLTTGYYFMVVAMTGALICGAFEPEDLSTFLM